MKDIYKDILYNYQKKVVDSSMGHDKYFLALEPGTGKTYTSLSIVQRKKYKKLVVVCQKSKIWDWQGDIDDTLGMKTAVLEGNKTKDIKTLSDFNEGAIISSYATIWRRDVVIDKDTALIIDESQYFKGSFRGKTSKLSKWGVQHSKEAGLVLLLSGTPINKPHDLFYQMKMLGMEMDKNEFAERFVIEDEQKFPGARWPVKVIIGYRNLDLLYKAFDSQKYSLKTKDALDLPKQNFIWMKLKHDRINLYNNVMKHKAYKDLDIPSDGVLFLRARQLASGYIADEIGLSNHKKVALKELLESNENNFVIFYNFIQELSDIKEVCKELDIKVFESNGETKNDYDAKEYNGRFIIAGQYISSAEGKNWQFVNHQVYYSPPISFMKYKQSLARIHRVGQNEHVFYYLFKTIGTVENKIYNSIKRGEDYDEKLFKKEKDFI